MKAAAEQCPNPYSKVGAPVEIPSFRSKGGLVFVSTFQGAPEGPVEGSSICQGCMPSSMKRTGSIIAESGTKIDLFAYVFRNYFRRIFFGGFGGR
jgi:hypothetical protein